MPSLRCVPAKPNDNCVMVNEIQNALTFTNIAAEWSSSFTNQFLSFPPAHKKVKLYEIYIEKFNSEIKLSRAEKNVNHNSEVCKLSNGKFPTKQVENVVKGKRKCFCLRESKGKLSLANQHEK